MTINNKTTLQDYAAKTRFKKHEIDIPFLRKEKIIPMGVDIGFSSTKVYSIFGQYVFPSLPIKVSDDFVSSLEDQDIMYKDSEGNIWFVGKLALKNLDEMKIQAQTDIIFGRNRINSIEFLVLLRVGLFLGLIEDDLGKKHKIANDSRLVIQTGLPDQYLNRDRITLKSRFVGQHCFQIKIGDRQWQTVSIDIKDKDISVMTQPFGTLCSLVTNQYGEITDIDLIKKHVLILDIGQRTTDTYYNKTGLSGISSTWEDLSMLEVIRKVKERVNLSTSGQGDFYDYFYDRILTLDTPTSRLGKIFYGDGQIYDITDDVFEITEIIAKNTIEQLEVVYDYLNEIDILILTGGMAKTFYLYLKDYYISHGLQILLAEKKDSENSIDNFNTVMANVVGFFNSSVCQLKQDYKIKR